MSIKRCITLYNERIRFFSTSSLEVPFPLLEMILQFLSRQGNGCEVDEQLNQNACQVFKMASFMDNTNCIRVTWILTFHNSRPTLEKPNPCLRDKHILELLDWTYKTNLQILHRVISPFQQAKMKHMKPRPHATKFRYIRNIALHKKYLTFNLKPQLWG